MRRGNEWDERAQNETEPDKKKRGERERESERELTPDGHQFTLHFVMFHSAFGETVCTCFA